MRAASVIAYCLCLGCTEARAAEPADVDAGREAAVGCVGCHAASGVDLSGREASDLVQRMQAMRDGRDTSHPPVLGLLSDRQLSDLAAYFSGGQDR